MILNLSLDKKMGVDVSESHQEPSYVDYLSQLLLKFVIFVMYGLIVLLWVIIILLIGYGIIMFPELVLLIILSIFSKISNKCWNNPFRWKCQRILLFSYPILLTIIIVVVGPVLLCYGIAYLMDYCKKKSDKGNGYKKETLDDVETAQ